MGEWLSPAPLGPEIGAMYGFRSTSDGSFSYQSGNLNFPMTVGWVAKLDANGTTALSKSIDQIVNASAQPNAIHFCETNRGSAVNDIIFADGNIYVCGESRPFGNDGIGYVARLSPDGTLRDWSMFLSSRTGNLPVSSRAVALCAYFRPDGMRIGVAGDFEGTRLKVRCPSTIQTASIPTFNSTTWTTAAACSVL